MEATSRLVQGVLAAAVAAGKILDPAAVFVGLYVDGPDPSPPDAVTAFTLPDATDVPTVAVTTWSDPYLLDDGRWAIQSPLVSFRLPDATNAFTASGWYLSTALTGGNILGWEAFGVPIPLPDEFHEVSLVVRITRDTSGGWAATVVIDG